MNWICTPTSGKALLVFLMPSPVSLAYSGFPSQRRTMMSSQLSCLRNNECGFETQSKNWAKWHVQQITTRELTWTFSVNPFASLCFVSAMVQFWEEQTTVYGKYIVSIKTCTVLRYLCTSFFCGGIWCLLEMTWGFVRASNRLRNRFVICESPLFVSDNFSHFLTVHLWLLLHHFPQNCTILWDHSAKPKKFRKQSPRKSTLSASQLLRSWVFGPNKKLCFGLATFPTTIFGALVEIGVLGFVQSAVKTCREQHF